MASSEHLPVPQLQPKRIIQVHWLNIKKGLIDLLQDPLILSQDIEIIIVIDARGVEEVGRGVGLLRDVFSLFLFVPFVRHDYQRKERVAVGRILVKGCLTCQYLSVLLEIYECMTISNDVNRVSVETVGRIKRAFLCLYTYRKCDSD